MEIGREEVKHVAQLSRLALTEAELVRMRRDLTEILTDMKTLEELEQDSSIAVSDDTLRNVMREDVIHPSCERAVLLANAPTHNGACMIVPKTVE